MKSKQSAPPNSDRTQEGKAYCEENQINLFRMERDKMLYRLLRIPVLQFED